MEKRLVVFLVVATLVMVGWMMLARTFLPPQPVPEQADPQAAEDAGDGDQGPGQPDEIAERPDDGQLEESTEDAPDADPDVGADADPEVQPDEEPPAAGEPSPPAIERRWLTLGSVDPNDPYRMLVTFVNAAAAIERIELSSTRFRDLQDKGGYMGHLSLTPREDGAGLRVNVVGAGTPAAKAACQTGGVPPGLKQGDVLLMLGPAAVMTEGDVIKVLAASRPGQSLPVTVSRAGADGQPRSLKFTVNLGRRPLEIVRPELSEDRDRNGRPDPAKAGLPRVSHPLSYLTTIEQLGSGVSETRIARGDQEIRGLPSLLKRNWEVVQDEDKPDEVAFRAVFSPEELKPFGGGGPLEIVKRFRLARVPADEQENGDYRAYHLEYDLEFRNLGEKPQLLSYRQQGPTGMPLEGWWFSNKIHPSFGYSAGTRDVIFSLEEGTHQGFNLKGCPQIVKQADKHPDDPETKLYRVEKAAALRYVGGDTQYFSTVLMPRREGSETTGYDFPEASAFVVAGIDPINKKRTDVTYRLTSRPVALTPNEPLLEKFVIFAGPKDPNVLAEYDLGDTIVYGWFAWVAVPMLKLLHFFHTMTFNWSYGLAIIMLTVLVRACMFPLSRKQVRSAQKMQELAPEMKKLAEKYKDDTQKKAAAQQELFRKHNYNPLGGCLLVFVQLPIFIGLYRCLSVDISLRQAPLIPGLSWCSNLAAPDQLWHWQNAFPPFFDFLVGPNGYLGPFLNILPLFTIVLFLMQQKMFTPPPTDDQQKMQQQVMTFMMIFIGVLFFRVPAGLCLYFIASSLWSVAERKLLPKTVAKPAETPAETGKTQEKVAAKKAKRKKSKQRR